jgi:hypothetical protein
MSRITDRIYLNDTHLVEWITQKGIIVGFFFTHPHSETKEECGGYVPLGKDDWHIRKFYPLTISPSIDCNACKSHGNIVDGKWYEAGEPKTPV